MLEKERKEMLNLADIIEGEINRMCVTNKLEELNSMYAHAQTNLNELAKMIYLTKFKSEGQKYYQLSPELYKELPLVEIKL